jgi:hypothetical protein
MIVELRVITEVAVVTIIEFVVETIDVAVLEVVVTVAVTVAILELIWEGEIIGLAMTALNITRKAGRMVISGRRYRFFESLALNFKSFTPN